MIQGRTARIRHAGERNSACVARLLCGLRILVTVVVAAPHMHLKASLGQLGGVQSIPATYLASIYPETAPTGQICLKIYRSHHTPEQADPGGDEPDRPHGAENSLLECAQRLH